MNVGELSHINILLSSQYITIFTRNYFRIPSRK